MSASRYKDDDRATIIAVSDVSKVNAYTMTSTLSGIYPISMDHNRRLINEIIDNAINERKGTCEVSSSQCSSLKLHSSEYSYDKRLEYWRNVLRDREEISWKIRGQTSKEQSDILYNRLVTVDERDKFTVKRVMDIAHRLKPSNLIMRQPIALKEKCDAEICKYIPEIHETLPKTERIKKAKVEIVGLPKMIQKELLGKVKWQGSRKPYSWLKSKHLENSIEERREDIERVLEYYPDTENLQIVGEGLLGTKLSERNSQIQFMSCKDICKVSADTILEDERDSVVTKTLEVVVDYAYKINDQEILIADHRCSRDFKTITNFTCFPFQTDVKKIFTIQNIGRKVLTFEWVHRSFYDKNSSLLKCSDNEFVFDTVPFRLYSGEVQEIFVKFQPRRVSVVKSKWALKVKPIFYKRKMDGIVMSLSGLCAVPPEYQQKLDEIQREVIEKSNKKMMKKLTTGLSVFATDQQPQEYICPYERSLNEMELFEQLNSGYKCERYNDLEMLKLLYQRIKKPRDKLWDLQINTLKSIIFNLPQAEARYLFFKELCDILNSMKGNSVDLETKVFDNTERYRSCFLYVRGIISTAIDEWIDLVSTLDETFYQTTLQVINEEQNAVGEEEEEDKDLFTLPENEDEKRQYVVEKRVRKLKPYRDALYMQTYTLICDFVENIVNIIESTV